MKKDVIQATICGFILGVVATMTTLFTIAAFQPDGKITLYIERKS